MKNSAKLPFSELESLPPVLTITQAREAAQLSRASIRRRISDGSLKAYRIGPKNIRIDRDSLIAMMRKSQVVI